MKRILCALLALLTLSLSAGCSYSTSGSSADPEASESSTEYLEAMDTYMTLTAYGSCREEALEDACQEIRRLEALLSTGSADSEVYALNQSGSAVLSDDTAALLERALSLYDSTGGAFDITVYPLMELWGFTTQNYQVPEEADLAAALALVGSDQLTYDSGTQTLTLGEGQAIDFGGIAKGYTSQQVLELFLEDGVTSAMVSLGGNIHCLGTKPDGSLWRIGIQDPAGDEGEIAAVVSVADQAVITSGGYQRFFTDEDTGEVYHHILDPATGCPAQSGLSSVTIVTGDGTLGDGLSTALYVMGLEEATAYWQTHSGEFQAILIDDDGAIYVTEGIADAVTAEGGFTVLTAEAES